MKNIVLSSVEAIAVAGMLTFSGCGSNGTHVISVKEKLDNVDATTKETQKISIVVGKDGKVSVSKKVVSSTKPGKTSGLEQTGVTVKELRECKDDNNQSVSCEQKCTVQDPCEVTVETGCGEIDNTKLNDFDKVQAAVEAFSDYNAAVADGNVTGVGSDDIVGFDGLTIVTSDDVTSCTFDYDTFIVCALDENGKKYYVSSEHSQGYAWVEVVTNDGTKTWYKVDIEFKSNGVEGGQPYIKLENLALNGDLPATIRVFSILKPDAPSHDSITGISGGTGVSGAGS